MGRYIFDKRVTKKALIKYGIMFLVSFPLLLWINYMLRDLSSWAVIAIDFAVLGTIVICVNMIIYIIRRNKQEKPDIKVIKK